MFLYSIGINHSTAPACVRERVAVSNEQLISALNLLKDINTVQESMVLSTCNRTEIYYVSSSNSTKPVIEWLCDFHDLQFDDVLPYLYTYTEQQVLEHAFAVASGLDSMVIGESQILGQMKTAFAQAHKNGNTRKVLNRLFQTAFAVAKETRTSTSIGRYAVSIAYAAVSLSKQIFADICHQAVLLVGAGETIELVAKHLHSQGVTNLLIANRTLERAEALAEKFSAQAISLHELAHRLPEADMVFSSTASTLPILGKGGFESALKKRKNKPMFVVDLAIPRDVEEEVSDLNNIYLYTIDDLEQVVVDNLENRRLAAKEASKIINNNAVQMMEWIRSLQSVPTIRDLRKHTSNITDIELINALKKLKAGEEPSLVLQQFAHALSQKFMHHPTESLRQNQDDELLDATRKLFALDSKATN